METPVSIDWHGMPIDPDPMYIYSLHDWGAVEEAVHLFSQKEVELAVHPNASLRFANEFVRECQSGSGAKEGYKVINPEIAYCKAELFQSLQPHVNALGVWADTIRTQMEKIEVVVREVWKKYNAALRNVFPTPSPESVVHEPLAKSEPVYLQLTGNRGLDLIAAPARRHFPEVPEKCTSMAEMALAQPSEAAVQTEFYKMNLQFLQEKLKLLGSFEDQVKKIHSDMHELLLGNTSVGAAKTVMDFVDIDMLSGKMTNDILLKGKAIKPEEEKSLSKSSKSVGSAKAAMDFVNIDVLKGQAIKGSKSPSKSPVKRSKSPSKSPVKRSKSPSKSPVKQSKSAGKSPTSAGKAPAKKKARTT